MRFHTSRRAIRPVSILAVGTLAIGLSACVSSTPPSDSITVALSGDPGSLDPTQIFGQAPLEMTNYFYENLLAFPDGGDPVGWIAESWEATSTEATFTLRNDVTCADGTPFTVADVEASFAYVSDPATAAYQYGSFVPAAGLEITTDDASRTITLTTLGGPDSFLAYNLGLVPLICLSGLDDPSVLATTPHGTGPYTLESSTAGQTYELALRDDYAWGIKPSNDQGEMPKSITIDVVDTDATRANLLVSDQAQIGTVGGGDRDRVDAASPATALELPINANAFIANETPGRPLDDVTVRKAMAHAIDKAAITSIASEGKGGEIFSLSPGAPVCPASDSSDSVPAFDPSLAGELLDDAGWVAGADGVRSKDGQPLRITILFGPEGGPTVAAAMELMQTQLHDVGVDAALAPTAEWVDTLFAGGDWDLVWFPVAGAIPSAWYNFFVAEPMPEGTSWSHIANDDYESIGAEANLLVGNESCGLWDDAASALFRDADVIPIGSSTRTIYGTNVSFDTQLFVLMPSTIRIGG